jgi:hypothetical protein
MQGSAESTDASKHKRNLLIFSSLMAALVLGVLPIGIIGPTRTTSPGNLGPFVAEAQNFGQRIIQGKVLSASDSPAAGATVFLKNLKSRTVKSFTSTTDGSFRFAQVGMIDDYEVWAEKGAQKSGVKTFDTRKLVEFDLKLK